VGRLGRQPVPQEAARPLIPIDAARDQNLRTAIEKASRGASSARTGRTDPLGEGLHPGSISAVPGRRPIKRQRGAGGEPNASDAAATEETTRITRPEKSRRDYWAALQAGECARRLHQVRWALRLISCGSQSCLVRYLRAFWHLSCLSGERPQGSALGELPLTSAGKTTNRGCMPKGEAGAAVDALAFTLTEPAASVVLVSVALPTAAGRRSVAVLAVRVQAVALSGIGPELRCRE
jgi:hypothetical protein